MCDVKLVMVGGGSFGWTHRLVTDVGCIPSLHGMHIVLHDIDPDPLEIVRPLCQKVSAAMGSNLRIESTTDLASALPGADFVTLTISTGGPEGNRLDTDIPARHGVLQTVGDTVGPGGWSRALRNIPIMVDIIRQVEAIAPNAWLINYSNPMTTLTRALQRASTVKTIGLCHELQGLLLHAAYFLGVDWQKDIHVTMAGINHLIWILQMDVCGRDGLELLRQYADDPEGFEPLGPRQIPEELTHAGGVNPNHRVKFDMLRRTGLLTGAGDGHTAEFFSHYLRDKASFARWGFDPEGRVHLFSHEADFGKRSQGARDLLSGAKPLWLDHSHEHADRIIASLTGHPDPLITPVNMANVGQVDNLPRDVVVETQAVVSPVGIQPIPVGRLPEAAVQPLMRHIPIQEMIVEAGLTGDRDLATLALSYDPQIPDPDVAQRIADDVFDEFRQWLPQFDGRWTWTG